MEMKAIIERLNALYHKRITVGLTPEEVAEQAALRKAYLGNIRFQVQQQLDRVEIVDDADEDHQHRSGCDCEHCH